MRVFYAENKRILKTEDSLAEGLGFEPTSDFRRIDLIAWQEDRRRPVLQ
jgi:hypothetical protein